MRWADGDGGVLRAHLGSGGGQGSEPRRRARNCSEVVARVHEAAREAHLGEGVAPLVATAVEVCRVGGGWRGGGGRSVCTEVREGWVSRSVYVCVALAARSAQHESADGEVSQHQRGFVFLSETLG